MEPTRLQVALETGKHNIEDITMNVLNFDFTSQPIDVATKEIICGVVGSGNLEILVTPLDGETTSKFTVDTSVTGFDHIWQAVLKEFSDRYAVGGLAFKINDMGATPAVVSLRLGQAIKVLEEESHG